MSVPGRGHTPGDRAALRFTLGRRDVEDLLAERGIEVSYEPDRRRASYFGSIIAADLRKRRAKPHSIWRLDEVCLKIDGRMIDLRRAVDAAGDVLDVLVQSTRDKQATIKPRRKPHKKYAVGSERFATDHLGSYGAAAP